MIIQIDKENMDTKIILGGDKEIALKGYWHYIGWIRRNPGQGTCPGNHLFFSTLEGRSHLGLLINLPFSNVCSMIPAFSR